MTAMELIRILRSYAPDSPVMIQTDGVRYDSEDVRVIEGVVTIVGGE